MVTRAQIGRISQQVERLAEALDGEAIAYIPVYAGETEDVAAHRVEHDGKPRARRYEFRRISGSREDAVASGVHIINCVSTRQIKSILESIDGMTRGIPSRQELTAEKDATA
jgi:hypothetical protein